MSGPTNADLMNAMIAISNKQVEDRVLLTTMLDSYKQRVVKAGKFEDDMRVQMTTVKADVKDLKREVAVMRPVVKKMRIRALVRRAIVDCVGRWWGLLTTAAVTIGGLFVWLGDHWPKVQTFLKKWLG